MRRTRPIRFWLGGTRRRCTCRGRETSSRRASGSITASDRVSCTRVPAFHHLLQGHQPDCCCRSHFLKRAFFLAFFSHLRRSKLRSDCRDEPGWLVKLPGQSFSLGSSNLPDPADRRDCSWRVRRVDRRILGGDYPTADNCSLRRCYLHLTRPKRSNPCRGVLIFYE